MLLNPNKINITLCGMMGSGKSVIGKQVAKNIDFNFIDTDQLIQERTNKSINKIFNEDGEKYFREIEEKIIIEILNNKNFVFSLGGGAIVNKNIRNILKKHSYNIYLEVEINILTERLINSKNRPLIKDKNIKKTLSKLFHEREKFYKMADLIINNEGKLMDVVKNITNKIKNL